ncbi:DMT family transporter [Microlunatus speluncae]|uniref:DMT family transporter n=1 Tax=Microlunatus speluncae TaxID=2594267 RepID=UPI0013759D46|nr:DMT family transporter [Microlunatus speluncae]
MSPRVTGSLLCALACVGVGASISITTLMRDFPIFGGQAVRYLGTALILALLLRLRGVPWLRPSVVDLLRLLALAGSGMVGFNLILIPATHFASPSLIGAILGCAPLIMAIVGPLVQRQRPRLGVIGCAAVVLVGIVIIEGVGGGSLLGTLLAIGVLLGELGFSLLAIPLLPRYGPLRVSCYASFLSAAVLLIMGMIAPGPLLRWPTLTEAVALAIMGLIFTPGAFAAWYAGLQRLGAASAGLWIGVIPLAAMGASVALGWESITIPGMIGSVLIGAGVTTGLLINRPPPQPPADLSELSCPGAQLSSDKSADGGGVTARSRG